MSNPPIQPFLQFTMLLPATFLILVAPFSHSLPIESQPLFSNTNRATWMSQVPNDQPLSLMTIPGTHDSGAKDGAWFSKCQSMSIEDQLNYGVRFLDIRCKVHDGKFTIHHGPIYEFIDFTKVLDETLDFLDKYPSEAVLMSIMQEESKEPDSEFISIFDQYMATKYKNGTYGDHMYFASGTLPTLQEIRGKVVIVSRVNGLPGIQWSDLDIQDDYDLGEIGVSGKWSKVQEQLTNAAQNHNQGSQKMFVNFASGCSYKVKTWAFPYEVARVVNKDLATYLNTTKCAFGDVCFYGIIPMDFPGKYDNDDLVDLLIKQNKIVS